MSESTDDAQRKTSPEVVTTGAEAPPGIDPPSPDADDVEVLAQQPAEPSTPRHDSVVPTSRKLAPPPKPKRDSANPGSMPPSAGDALGNVGSLRAPAAPSISYHDASASSRDAVASALSGSESLRAIGEALSKDAGAFSATEAPTGGRPPVPRPRSQPEISLGSESPPQDTPATPAAKPAAIFAQRIIPVGTPSERPLPKPAPAPSRPELDLDRTLQSEERPVEASPVAEHVQTAQPPLVAPMALELTPLPVVPAPIPELLPPAPPPPVELLPPAPPPPVELLPPAPPPPVELLPPAPPPPVELLPIAPPPPVELLPIAPPPPVELLPIAPPPPVELQPIAASTSPELEASVSVDIHVEEGPADLTSADIPVTTDYDDEPPTSPHASEGPLPPPLAVSETEATVLAAAASAERAEPLSAEDAPPDSAERVQVEELSREDSPSIPPEAPPLAVPPPVPAREAKPPPPPRRPALAREELTSPDAEKKKAAKQKRAWWEELFSEDFVRANWKVSDEQIKREVTFVEESLGVAPGGVVLDLGCGSGQHAVELASRGYGVVGYDLSLYQLALAADIAQERSQKINFLQGDMREMAFEEMFDGIFCWNTTFGYFEEDKNFSVAERAFRALRPGGMLLVDVMNRDFVAAHTPSSVWFEGDACVCMDDAVIDYFTSRLRVKRSVILDDGRTRECTYSVRLYSFHELGKLLHEVGFRVTEVSGHPATPGVFLGQASPRILMLAQRP